MNAHNPHLPTGEPIVGDENTSGEMQVPQITLITKRDAPPVMSKRIWLDAQGALQSDGSECRMTTGTAAREFAETASALALVIAHCRSDQAIALGSLKVELPDSVAVTIPSKLANHPGAITRSRSCIDYQPGLPAWCLIDFDTKGMPKEISRADRCRWRYVERAVDLAPVLAKAARVSRASTTRRPFSERHHRA